MKQTVTGLTSLVALAIAITATGCKEDTVIKPDLVPGQDSFRVFNTDGLNMITTTEIIDTLNTSANIANQPVVHGAGTVVDPILGRTTAGIYFQVLPPSNQFSFSNTIDSAVLILPYTRFSWGDASDQNSQQTFTVHRTSEALDKSATYYSNQVKETNEQISQPFSFNPKMLSETVPVLGANRSPHLRIPLNINGQWFTELRDQAKNATTNGEFVKLLRGIYVKPGNTNSRLLPYFYLDGINDYERAAIQFFYKTDSVRSVFFNFVRGECAHYNYITRDNDELNAKIKPANDAQDKLYLQNEPGAAISIKINNLKDIDVSVVNSAILEISQVTAGNYDDDTSFVPPTRLVPYVIAADGTIALANEASGTLGGDREIFSFNGLKFVRYRINLGNTVQTAIVNKWDMLHLRIVGAKGFPGAYRLVAGGRQYPEQSLKTQLKIFYSKPQ